MSGSGLDAYLKWVYNTTIFQMVKTSYRAMQHVTLAVITESEGGEDNANEGGEGETNKGGEGEASEGGEGEANDGGQDKANEDGEEERKLVDVSTSLSEHESVLYVDDPDLLSLVPLSAEEGTRDATVVFIENVDKVCKRC